jgi:predicted DNA-binding protein (MmcQ/YjbR family)
MPKSVPNERHLDRITEICLACPEATREQMGRHASFTVRKRKFAYFLIDHHGDGIVSVCFKTQPGDNEILLRLDAQRFYKPAYIGHMGWVGLRLDLGRIDWQEVAEFLTGSYRLAAPKRLAALVATRQG